MPGKKRKADSKMWGSSPSSSSSSARRKGGGSSSRRGPGSGAYHNNSSGINESKAEKLFDQLCDEDNPCAASMEGELLILFIVVVAVFMVAIDIASQFTMTPY